MLVFVLIPFALFAEEISYDEAVTMLQNVSQADYPEADQISVNNEIINLDEKCKGTYFEENYQKILTERGRKYTDLWFGYDTMYDTVFVKTVQIIKKDGKVVDIDPYSILIESNNALSKFSNIYSETSKLLKGDLPNIEIGDIIRTITIRTVHNTRMENHYYAQISVETHSPILKRYYELNLPENINLNIHHINEKSGYVNYSEENINGKKIYKFNISVAPQILYEPSMESSDEFAYYILLTTIESWEELSKWYYSIVAPHLDVNDEIIAKTKELTADCKTRKEKAEKLYYWVAKKVRYLGVDKETYKPGYEPHDVSYTFSTLGGVCRDKAALLVTMLRIAEIEADPILIASGYKLNPIAPVMWFNHAVAVSYDEKGDPEFFFDPTDENSKELFPQYLEDCSYIIASEKGNTLKVVPLSPAENNNVKISLSIDIDKNDSAVCSLQMDYTGLADGFMRGRLMRMNPQKKQEMIESIISKIHPFSNLIDYSVSDPNNTDEYISMSINFEISDYVSESNDLILVPLEAYKLSMSFLYGYQLRAFNLSERKYPFKLDNTYSIDISETIKFPEKMPNITFPKITEFNKKGFNFRSNLENKDNQTISFNSSFSTNKIHFKKEDFSLLKNEIANLAAYEKLYLIIKNQEN